MLLRGPPHPLIFPALLIALSSPSSSSAISPCFFSFSFKPIYGPHRSAHLTMRLWLRRGQVPVRLPVKHLLLPSSSISCSSFSYHPAY